MVASDAKVCLVAGRTSVSSGGGLWAVVVLAPRDHVVAGAHHLVAFVAGVAPVS